jgi:hypothetical protein
MVTWTCGPLMKQIYNTFSYLVIRLSAPLSLIFFACTFLSCHESKEQHLAIRWKNNQATGIQVPKKMLPGINEDSLSQWLKIKVSKGTGGKMIGSYTSSSDFVLFSPLLPLSRGLSYEIYYHDQRLGNVLIPGADASDRPRLLSIYPTADELPENLLKFYVQFSTKMREGEALKNILLLDEKNDTLHDIFLDLKPELWNEEGNTLTIWLDPGRIKRELIPNQRLGNPLQKGKRYTLLVSEGWKDVQGKSLTASYRKDFTVVARDSVSPDIETWHLSLPTINSRRPLEISLNESLDYFLLQETIFILDGNEKILPGKFHITSAETTLAFTPADNWKAGDYQLVVAEHLEDLAGNNLKRPFDRDLQAVTSEKTPALQRHFELREYPAVKNGRN